MAWDITLIAVSFVVLAASGDQFVIGVGRLSAAIHVRPTVVGAVIGGLGASFPDLLVAGVASARGTPQLAVGTLVGSNIANVCLALGLAALVAPIRVDSRTLRREMPVNVGGVLVFSVLLIGGLRRLEGVGLLMALLLAVGILVTSAGRSPKGDELEAEVKRFFPAPGRRPTRELAQTVLALVFMVGAAEVLVRSSTTLAARFAIAESLVGLTVVALGTSAPLIAIAIQAARRGNHDLVVGNVLGSNLFIALAGGAVVALVHPGGAASVGQVPVWVMAGTAVASWALMARGNLITRWEASMLIAAYGIALPFVAR
jgi:cation:H+ antiporter